MKAYLSVFLVVLMGCTSLDGETPSVPTTREAYPFGVSEEEAEALLADRYESFRRLEHRELMLPTAQRRQTQIDAFGDRRAPWATKSEWLFADNELDLVWVLVEEPFLHELRQVLEGEGIVPDYRLPGMGDFYLRRGFGIRYDPPEFFYFSPRLTEFYRVWLENQ